MTYTGWVVLAVAVVIGADLARTRLTLCRRFWLTYGVVLFFQLITNGWLTGREIVTYSADAVIGGAHPRLIGSGRLIYEPVEDLLFGFALVLWTLVCWELFGRAGSGQQRRARR
jgi:hypothetical protein